MRKPVVLSPTDSTLVVSVADVERIEGNGADPEPTASVRGSDASDNDLAEPLPEFPQETIARPGPRLVVVPPPQQSHEDSSVVSSTPHPEEETTLVGTPKAFVVDLESGTTRGEVSGLLHCTEPQNLDASIHRRAHSHRRADSNSANTSEPKPHAATFAGPDSRPLVFDDQTAVAVPSARLLRACAQQHEAAESDTTMRPGRAPTVRCGEAEAREARLAVSATPYVFGDCDLDDGDVTVITRAAPLPPTDSAAPGPSGHSGQDHTVSAPTRADMPMQPPRSMAADVDHDGVQKEKGEDSLFAAPPPINAELTLKGKRVQSAGWAWSSQPKKLRRRILLVVFLVLAGAWIMFLRPDATLARQPEPRGGIVGVQPVAGETPRVPALQLPAATGTADLAKAAEHLAAGRLKEALPMYRALAAKRPNQPVYRVIVNILAREILERCRQKGESECQ